MLRYTTDKAETWFSRLLRHPARKRSGSIFTTPEPARGCLMCVTPKSLGRQLATSIGDDVSRCS